VRVLGDTPAGALALVTLASPAGLLSKGLAGAGGSYKFSSVDAYVLIHPDPRPGLGLPRVYLHPVRAVVSRAAPSGKNMGLVNRLYQSRSLLQNLEEHT
jgi:hypothetical protein